ncbi:hypothetical protein ACIQXV_06905 [Neobacillus sp. NPDC097160]|uniref:hypothetical protein n=1 Tax=Neobacillus sp. NPDC097160 TaxID=3364298 RepID=UPI003803CC00
MLLKEQTQKYYKGNLTFFDDAQKQVEELENIYKKEKRLMELNPFGDEIADSDGKNDFAVLDNVNTLKNLMAFAEITRYREDLLAEMPEDGKRKVIQLIIDNLKMFHVKPVAYEIKKDSIIVAWYLNSVINTFTFSDQVEALAE